MLTTLAPLNVQNDTQAEAWTKCLSEITTKLYDVHLVEEAFDDPNWERLQQVRAVFSPLKTSLIALKQVLFEKLREHGSIKPEPCASWSMQIVNAAMVPIDALIRQEMQRQLEVHPNETPVISGVKFTRN